MTKRDYKISSQVMVNARHQINYLTFGAGWVITIVGIRPTVLPETLTAEVERSS